MSNSYGDYNNYDNFDGGDNETYAHSWSKRPLSAKMKGKNMEVEPPKKPPDLSTGGVGGKGFPTLIRDLRRNYEAHLIILLETHISGDWGKIIRNKMGFDSCCVEEARGHSGGIWVLWDFHYWKVEAIQQHIQFIHLKIEGRDSMPWMLTAIYGSPQRLMPSIKHLPSLKSNHSPIYLQLSPVALPNRRRRPFHFLAAWLNHPKFDNLVSNNWRVQESWSNGVENFKSSLKTWNSEVFGDINRKKSRILRRLQGINNSLNNRNNKFLEKLQKDLWADYEVILE
ncbi:uncharacterized protein [Arachis hypogaea]|uniref:uncharacterized protein n=1 Tax=Arachis hypogaea TaxID=3818 RepID=UPI003B20B7D7